MPYLWVPPAATKGRLLVADGTTWQPLTVGSNNQVLTADSAQSTGVKWAAAGGGGSSAEGFRARLSATQTGLSATTWTQVTFNTEDRDDGSDFNTSTYTWTVPSTGWYHVAASISFSTNAMSSGDRFIVAVRVGGVEAVRLHDVSVGAATGPVIGGSRPMYLTASDAVTVWAWRTSAGDIAANTVSTFFTAVSA